MAMTLRSYLNAKLKAMGKTATQAKKDAGKYKSIAAAKKAGSLYYTDKNGKVMAAVYAEDLKKSPKPKPRPKVTERKLSPHKTGGGRGDGTMEMNTRLLDPKSPSRLKGSSKRKKELELEKQRLQKIVDAGKKKKPPVVKRREQARIREINSILKRMK